MTTAYQVTRLSLCAEFVSGCNQVLGFEDIAREDLAAAMSPYTKHSNLVYMIRRPQMGLDVGFITARRSAK